MFTSTQILWNLTAHIWQKGKREREKKKKPSTDLRQWEGRLTAVPYAELLRLLAAYFDTTVTSSLNILSHNRKARQTLRWPSGGTNNRPSPHRRHGDQLWWSPWTAAVRAHTRTFRSTYSPEKPRRMQYGPGTSSGDRITRGDICIREVNVTKYRCWVLQRWTKPYTNTSGNFILILKYIWRPIWVSQGLPRHVCSKLCWMWVMCHRCNMIYWLCRNNKAGQTQRDQRLPEVEDECTKQELCWCVTSIRLSWLRQRFRDSFLRKKVNFTKISTVLHI